MKRVLFIVVMQIVVCGVFAIPLSGVGKHRQYNKALVQAQNQLKEKVIQRAGRYGYILHNPYGKTYPIRCCGRESISGCRGNTLSRGRNARCYPNHRHGQEGSNPRKESK